MIRFILRKDWTLLWPLAVLVTAIQVGFECSTYRAGFFGESPLAAELERLLTIAWAVGIVSVAVAAVQEDPVPGAEQDWLIRPLARTDLLLAKLLFVLIVVCLPMGVVNLVHELALGFPAGPSFLDALYKEAFVFLCLLLPAVALASMTRNMTEFVLMAAALVVLYALSEGVSSVLRGPERCPTCDTAISWTQHLLQHMEVLAGTIVILALQYYRRRTEASRVVAAIGIVAIVFVQLSWGTAFGIQTWLAGSTQGEMPSIAIDAAASAASGSGHDATKQGAARGATQALLRGNVGAAVEDLKRYNRPEDATVIVDLPLQIGGISPQAFLLADRAQFTLTDARGVRLYRGMNEYRGSVALLPDPTRAGAIHQTAEIPGAVYRRARAQKAQLSVAYSLTLMRPVSEYKMRALDGELRVPELGICQSKGDNDGIRIRCQEIGRPPICFSATLYGPDGTHDRETFACVSDYRPFIPAPMTILTVSGIDLAVRDPIGLAHYPVDVADLPESYLLVRVYGVAGHFRREASAPLLP